MTQAIQKKDGAQALEQALLSGDLANLSPQDRIQYYKSTCDSLGLNPLTKPFEYIKLNGKLTLYARKDATDQLRKIHGVSIDKPDIQQIDNLIIVTVSARDKNGRTDSDIGVVGKGDMAGNVGNALMKAVTKAKRRVTLSICGLGMLDESELDSIPPAAIERPAPPVMIEAPHADLSRLETLKPIVTALNKAGDEIKWTPAALLSYAMDLFGFEAAPESIEALDDEQFALLVEDLGEQLKGLGDGQG